MNMRLSSAFRTAFLAALFAAMLAAPAEAEQWQFVKIDSVRAINAAIDIDSEGQAHGVTDSTWTGNVDDDWSNPGNWDADAGIPNGVGDTARLTGDIVSHTQITIDVNVPGDGVTLGSLYLADDGHRYTIARYSILDPAKNLIFDSAAGAALIESTFTSDYYYDTGHAISAPVVLMDPLTVNVLSDRLTLSGGVSSQIPGTGITKTGPGTLILNVDPDGEANDYTGPTIIAEGVVRVAERHMPWQSNVAIGGGGILEDGGTRRSLGTGPGQIQWTGSGGFSGGSVNIGDQGTPQTLTWGQPYFVPVGSELIFNSPHADGVTEFENPLDLAGGTRTVHVNSGWYGQAMARLEGALSNGALTKTGEGTLELTAVNTYTGPTTVAGGILHAEPGVGLPDASNLVLADGLLEVTETTTFTRSLGTGTGQVQWTGSAGFSGSVTVNLGGEASPTPLVWGAGHFVPHGSDLILNAQVELTNPIDLAGDTRTVRVPDGLCILSGAVSGTGASVLRKTGEGVLRFGAADLIADTVGLHVTEGMLDFQTHSETVGPVILDGGTIAGSGTLTAADYDVRSGTVEVGLAGPADLTKSTPGEVFLSGVAGYTGTTTISDGSLYLMSVSNLPSGNLCLAGGYLRASGNFNRDLGTGNGQVQWTGSGGFTNGLGGPLRVSINGGAQLTWGAPHFVPDGCELVLGMPYPNGPVDFQNPIDLGSEIRTVRVTDSPSSRHDEAVLSGRLSGSGGLTKTGTGLLKVAADNTYTGPTTVAEGTLWPVSGFGLPYLSNLILAGGSLRCNGIFTRSLGTGPGQIQWTGRGGFSAGYSSHAVINLGGEATPATVVWGAGGFVPDGADLVFGPNTPHKTTDFRNPIDLVGGTRTVTVYDNYYEGGDEAILSGAISGGGLVKAGNGVLVLSSANTFDGPLTVQEGYLNVAHPQALGSPAGETIIAAGAQLYLGEDMAIAGEPLVLAGSGPSGSGAVYNVAHCTWTGPVSLADDALIYVGGGHSLTIGGPVATNGKTLTFESSHATSNSANITGDVSGTGGLHVSDSCTVTLSGTNTYTGRTVISDGTLRLGSPDALPPGRLLMEGGTLDLDGHDYTMEKPDGYGYVKLGTGTLTLDAGPGEYEFHCNVSGDGGITKTGSGRAKLSAPNTYAGPTIIREGVLSADSEGLPESSNLVFDGGVLGYGGPFERDLGTGPGEVQWLGSGGFRSGSFRIGEYGSLLVWDEGGFVPDASELLFDSSVNTSFGNRIDLNGGVRTIRVNKSPEAPDRRATLKEGLSGDGGLRKMGAGTLVLQADNTYTGPTIVEEGVLKLNSPNALPPGSTVEVRGSGVLDPGATPYTFDDQSLLTGGGGVLGTVITYGTVAPGDGTGVMRFFDITCGRGSRMEIELGGRVWGFHYDCLVSLATITIQDGSILDMELTGSFTPAGGDVFDILDFETLEGGFSSVQLPTLRPGLWWNTDALYVDGTVEVVPEPATLSLVAAGLAAVWMRKRRVTRWRTNWVTQ